jgi:hypothetical protein
LRGGEVRGVEIRPIREKAGGAESLLTPKSDAVSAAMLDL